MNQEILRIFCLSLPGVCESFPFDNKTLVFKVGDKMFALFDCDSFQSINLKCDPTRLIELRETYFSVQPGYHMNKKHWMTVGFNGDVSNDQLIEWVENSYKLVFNKLSKKAQDEITH